MIKKKKKKKCSCHSSVHPSSPSKALADGVFGGLGGFFCCLRIIIFKSCKKKTDGEEDNERKQARRGAHGERSGGVAGHSTRLRPPKAQ